MGYKITPPEAPMPELPEVETHRRGLVPLLVGRAFAGVDVLWPKAAAAPLTGVAGQTVQRIDRRGKYLLFGLERDWLLVHLRMTGRLEVADGSRPCHTTLAFRLAGGGELRLIDPRKFGRAWLVADPQSIVGDLGPEPLSPQFTARTLAACLAGRRAWLKPLLLDQRVLVGLGNIYVDEALHRARLHPLRSADSLTPNEMPRLHRAIRAVLREGIAHGGTTIISFAGPDGEPGRYRAQLRVFRRTGEPCLRCGTAIVRTVVAQRGTHLCPQCQPL